MDWSKTKKKKKKEKEIDRGRDSLSDSRILPRFPGNDDTDGTDHWEELLRADSARVRRAKKVRERQTEREMEREIERGERERALRAQPFLVSVRLSLSLSPTLLLLPPRSKLLFSSGYTTDSPLFLSLSLLHRLSRSLSIAPSFCSFFLALSSVSVWFPKTCSFDSLWSHYTMKKRLSRREVELRMRKNATEQMSIRDIERNS